MSDHPVVGRAARLDRALADLLGQAPELEAAAVVSFDGLAMASALPDGMDEDRVAAMSAALLSLGEKAAAGLGRGDLSQVYVEGETGTVFLVSCDDEAVLVAVAAAGAKAGLMLFEVRRAAKDIGVVLQVDAHEDAPVEVDADILADAEAAYAAHKAAQTAQTSAAPEPEPEPADLDEPVARVIVETPSVVQAPVVVAPAAETPVVTELRDPAAREEAERAQREAALAFLPSTSPILMPADTPVHAAPGREVDNVLDDDRSETSDDQPVGQDSPAATPPASWAPYIGQAPHWS